MDSTEDVLGNLSPVAMDTENTTDNHSREASAATGSSNTVLSYLVVIVRQGVRVQATVSRLSLQNKW